ncbi:pantoate kinase [Methanolobus chelungpuianus]|uniref:Pantoate kinase n=1 Tax=Methanolobus chelungpuianus TaxID=502115 RepID=A0AAE3H9L2_9EURY|nr:pantoate kinase [Methanolobus chelungpuianus]MCQ6962127.1 pantothenate kinase [Methanolobus chelungpuianus]
MNSHYALSARAFAPAHITGFFEVHDHADPMKKGSTGCGIVLSAGIETTVTMGEGIEETVILLNGKEVEGITSRTVVEMLTDRPVRVESTTQVPVECGLGASGAGSLGTAYALNRVLSLNLTTNKLNGIAHVAEVRNSSGLGDVAAQSLGGAVIRTSPGAPGVGSCDRIPSGESDVYCVVLGKLSTGMVLGSREAVRNINDAGKEAMKRLMVRPCMENFMRCARDFSIGANLATDEITDIIEAVEAIGGMASQAMLGNTVFAVGTESTGAELKEVLSGFGQVLHYRINPGSIRMI